MVERELLSRPHGLYSADDIRFIARTYFETAGPAGLDPIIAIGQARLETANFSSTLAQVPYRNPAGIGADDSAPHKARKFPSWVVAVRAHVGRLLAYALKAGAETDAQRTLVQDALIAKPLPGHLRGSAPQLSGLAPWASDPQYVDKLCRVISRFADQAPTAPGTAPRIITARSIGLSFQILFGELGPEEWVTGHYSAGARARDADEGVRRVLSFHDDHRDKGWGGLAYHYVVPDDGTLICGRPTLAKGTHTRLHNSNNIGVNMPGTLGDRPTAAQAATFAWLLANAHTEHLPKPHRTDRDLRQAKIRGHRQWPDNSTDCPGDFLAMYLARGELEAAPALQDGPAPIERDVARPPGEWVGDIYADHEYLGIAEARDGRQPSAVEPVVPAADPRFDSA